MKISFVLPFNNEKANLSLLLPLIEQEIKKENNLEFEINLVDDLSSDESYSFCEKFIEDSKLKAKYKLYKLDTKGYQTGALKKGFIESTGDYIICMDTDLQDDPKYIPEFIDNIKKGFDIVIGVRKNRKAPIILTAGLKIYDLIFEIIFKKKLSTYRAPFVAYKKEYVNDLPWYNNDHRYFIPIAINKGAKLIKEFDVSLNKRNSGKSHYNKYFKVFWGIVELLIFIFRMKTGKYS